LLLLDEPTANLDPATELHVINTLRKLKQERKINLIIATHKKGVLDLVDRAIVIEHGKVVTDGTPQSVIGNQATAKKRSVKPQIKVSNSRNTAKA